MPGLWDAKIAWFRLSPHGTSSKTLLNMKWTSFTKIIKSFHIIKELDLPVPQPLRIGWII